MPRRVSRWANSTAKRRPSVWPRRRVLVAGSYGNYVSDEGDLVARTAYGSNYDRLVALKDKYDPTNFFHMNHNIRPSQAAPPMMGA